MPYLFPEEEHKILKFWDDNDIFNKTLEKTKDEKPFVFYDGPPFATGLPHYGHLLQSAIKDVIPRYKTMQGFYVRRQWGWDCHGLPIENIVEKELGTKSKKDIVAMGVKKFNDLCRERVFTFISEWERIIPRFGRWSDMKAPYRTMDFNYMQSEWWAFKELHKKGLIYEDYRSMHICPRCETTLSQGEVADGYKDIKDLSVTVKFKLKNPEKIGLKGNVFMLAWTTTPWTLPGNVALAIGKNINYVFMKKDEEVYIVARNRKDILGEGFKEIISFDGDQLEGIEYEPLFNYYASDANLKNRENGWKVYAADFVNDQDGTGIAHEAPTFGADDWSLLKKVNLPFVQHVKMDGTFKSEVLDFPSVDLKPRAKDKPEEIREADLTVVKFLEEKALVFSYEKYEHSYPHCWRCDTALINYATSSWFVAVEKIKPMLLETAKKINWMPEHIKEGRFGQWLEGARDWSISRQRFWANTIPVWRCDTCNKDQVFASATELKKASGVLVTDLHKDVVDVVTFACSCGGLVKRIPDVLDTWFDSGSVPFASLGYPLENKKEVKKRLPADFIGEAQDQTRAWFYYQHVLIGALFGTEAFKNCIVTGIVLAEDGKKMSKKLKNYPDPVEIMEKHGADAMRLYMLSSPVVRAENLLFSEKGVEEIKRKLLTLENVYTFFTTYVDKKDFPKAPPKSPKHILDKWIISKIEHLVLTTEFNLDKYDIPKAVVSMEEFFINDLSLWYIRRSRKRFHETSPERKEAIETLYYVLLQTAKIIAPVTPFFAEKMYQNLKTEDMPESVHLCNWPKNKGKNHADLELEQNMDEVRNLVTASLAQRQVKAMKVRQPLASLTIKNEKSKIKNSEDLLDLIKDEVNVKEVLFDGTIEEEILLDVNLTTELKEEGLVRDIVRFVQDMRKEQGLKPEDKVIAEFAGSEKVNAVLEKNKEFLAIEIRAREVVVGKITGEGIKEMEVEDGKLSVVIKK